MSVESPEVPTVESLDIAKGSQFKSQVKRLRQGDSGLAPIVIGLLALGIYFQIRQHSFLSAANLTNLAIQATVFILLGMAEIWLLLLGEIDLSVGYVMGLGAAIATIQTDVQFHWAWYFGVLLAVGVTTVIGILQGLLTIGLKVPSFIVTLAGSLFWLGVMIWYIDRQGTGGSVSITNSFMYGLVNKSLSPLFTWIVLIGMAVVMSVLAVTKDVSRRRSGLDSVPTFVTVTKVVVFAAVAVILGIVFNTDRSSYTVLRGMPWAVPIVFAVLALYSFMLTRTKPGRYIYAIGGNAEAARRGGVNVNRYRLLAFALTGFTAGIAGLLYASTLNGVSDAIPGGTLVLYAVASAVIGGTSLFGGRGKMIHALVGGLVIATIYNGMALIQLSAPIQYMATAIVLLVAVTIDSIARRSAAASR